MAAAAAAAAAAGALRRRPSLAAVSRQRRQPLSTLSATATTTSSSSPSPLPSPAQCSAASHPSFTLEREEFVPEVNSTARLFRHKALGTELLSLCNDDENKTFAVTLKTVPSDSTGVPHILEHSVLNGSRKYPVKEPMVELIKSSLNTFINAFTFPDKTCYPVSSAHVADFNNLVDVYLDAVFFPRLSEDERAGRDVLAQEGHHIELESKDGRPAFKGVVYNEMKGVFSSPESVLMSLSQRLLFPDTAYGVESGGDPRNILDLTWEQFRAFYDTFYHPSNARLWFYGDDPEEGRLRKAAEVLDAYAQEKGAAPPASLAAASQVRLQRRFDAPREHEFPYDAGADGKHMATLNWLLPEVTSDPGRVLSLVVLGHVLAGTSASPLRKALTDSALGEDVLGGGVETDLRQMVFSIGLKGMAADGADKMQQLVLDTLRSLRLTDDMVQSSLNTIEFAMRENNTGSFPKGLALMLRSLTTWLHDADPLAPLRFEQPLEALKARLASNEPVFEGLIREELLDNPHRVRVTLRPDAEYGKQQEAAESARLDAVRASMSGEELERTVRETQRLRGKQQEPDAPEALAKVPRLQVDDLDRRVKTVPMQLDEVRDVRVLSHPLFTNGVAYVDVGLDMSNVPTELLPLVGMYSEALLEMGTAREDFVSLQRRIGRDTGGMRASVYASHMVRADGNGPLVQRLFLRGKAMAGQTGKLLGVMSEVLNEVSLDNCERFRQVLLEERAGLEASMVPSGHQIVASRLRGQYRASDWCTEQLGGVSYLHYLRALERRVEQDWHGVAADLRRLHAHVVNRAGAVVNVTTDEYDKAVRPLLPAFVDSLRSAPPSRNTESFAASLQPRNEGLTIPSQVNYVGKAANLRDLGYEVTGASALVSKHLGMTYLWDKLRVQGGAYGGFCRLDMRTGTFAFLSYRDPNVKSSVEHYDGAAAHLQRVEVTRDELDKSIIGTIGDMDAYQLPDVKGYASTLRYLGGESDAVRQQRREEVLGTTQADFRRMAEALEAVRAHGTVVVVGSAEAIARARDDGLALDDVAKLV